MHGRVDDMLRRSPLASEFILVKSAPRRKLGLHLGGDTADGSPLTALRGPPGGPSPFKRRTPLYLHGWKR